MRQSARFETKGTTIAFRGVRPIDGTIRSSFVVAKKRKKFEPTLPLSSTPRCSRSTGSPSAKQVARNDDSPDRNREEISAKMNLSLSS